MKLSRPAAVFAAVVALAGGAAVAVSAATGTDPVTLCSSAKTGAVTVPNSSGACAKGTTAFSVASDAAVQALATRLGTAETDLSAAGTRIAAAEADLAAAEARIAATETELADQAAALQALDADFRDFTPSTLELDEFGTQSAGFSWRVRVEGVGLKPGADVQVRYTTGLSISTGSVVGTVRSDGVLSLPVVVTCMGRNFYFTTLTDGDDPISTVVVANGPGC